MGRPKIAVKSASTITPRESTSSVVQDQELLNTVELEAQLKAKIRKRKSKTAKSSKQLLVGSKNRGEIKLPPIDSALKKLHISKKATPRDNKKVSLPPIRGAVPRVSLSPGNEVRRPGGKPTVDHKAIREVDPEFHDNPDRLKRQLRPGRLPELKPKPKPRLNMLRPEAGMKGNVKKGPYAELKANLDLQDRKDGI